MKVIVMGGGVVGVTTAYYLAKAGAEVTLIERQPAAAQETSLANAGLIAPGHSFAWASPRAPGLLIKSLWRKDTAFRMRLKVDPRMWGWGLRFLKQCTAERARANTLRKLSLCFYSQKKLVELRQETGIDYHQYNKGLLYFYRDPKHFEQGVATMTLLKDHGLPVEVIDAARCARIEPALADFEDKLAGAVYCPTDESGDCNVFTERLVEISKELGVSFKFGTTISGLDQAGDRISGVLTDREVVRGDMYVLALGSYSPLVARSVAVKLPIYPVKGYSLTLPISDADAAPTVGGVDEGMLVAYCRMGDQLRLTATADFAGYDTSCKPKDFATMLAVGRELFPRGIDFTRPTYRACLRPMTPDGPPILGKGRHANLFLNTGHGHIGWTMACGSSRILADLILGRKPEIDIEGLTLDRYASTPRRSRAA